MQAPSLRSRPFGFLSLSHLSLLSCLKRSETWSRKCFVTASVVPSRSCGTQLSHCSIPFRHSHHGLQARTSPRRTLRRSGRKTESTSLARCEKVDSDFLCANPTAVACFPAFKAVMRGYIPSHSGTPPRRNSSLPIGYAVSDIFTATSPVG